jgi:hypothetical protein
MIIFRKKGKLRNLMTSGSGHLRDLSKKRSTSYINRRRSLRYIGRMSRESKMLSLTRIRYSWTTSDAWTHPSTCYSKKKLRSLQPRCSSLISMTNSRINKTKLRIYSSSYLTSNVRIKLSK